MRGAGSLFSCGGARNLRAPSTPTLRRAYKEPTPGDPGVGHCVGRCEHELLPPFSLIFADVFQPEDIGLCRGCGAVPVR